jgi:hypothetical protein
MDAQQRRIIILTGALCSLGSIAGAQPLALDHNWNGMVHDGEQTVAFADDPAGFRSMSDRAVAVGSTNSLGGVGYNITTAEGTYIFEPGPGILDMMFIGVREAGGPIGWDLVPDGDRVGIAPNWDPTGGDGTLTNATTTFPSIPMNNSSQVSILYNASVGGGPFEVTLGFVGGQTVTVPVTSPDWFADFDPVPPAPMPGVESQIVLPGPLSGGDGFRATNNVDYALPGEPLAVFEAVISATSLLDVGFNMNGLQLNSVDFDATILNQANANAAVGILGMCVNGDNVVLDFNWNGMAHPDEVADAKSDEPNGYRSIGDRGFIAGQADSMGGAGFQLSNEGRTYQFVGSANAVDMTMIGTRPAAWDATADGDAVGVAPNWDPSKGGGIVIQAISSLPDIDMDAETKIGFLYHASSGGGNFDVILGFDDGDSVTVTVNAPDWFANANPVPPAPMPGVESQTVVPGPLSGGDGFLGAGGTDHAILDAPLTAFEAVISAASLSDIGFDIDGRQLSSITFDAINLLLENPNAAVGIYGASIGAGGCFPDCDNNGALNILDFVCYQQAFVAGDPNADCDGNGSLNILDFVCYQQAFLAGCP